MAITARTGWKVGTLAWLQSAGFVRRAGPAGDEYVAAGTWGGELVFTPAAVPLARWSYRDGDGGRAVLPVRPATVAQVRRLCRELRVPLFAERPRD